MTARPPARPLVQSRDSGEKNATILKREILRPAACVPMHARVSSLERHWRNLEEIAADHLFEAQEEGGEKSGEEKFAVKRGEILILAQHVRSCASH